MKKIMFSDRYELTQAVLEGRKTMTRRVCKYDRPDKTYYITFPIFEPNDYDNDGHIKSPLNYVFGWKHNNGDFTGWNSPQYKVGEVVAIAQNYETILRAGKCSNDFFVDSSTINKKYCGAGYGNKMLAKAELMLHHIRIKDIWMEKLQSITDGDCLKEGVELNTRQYEYDGTKRYCVRGLGHWRAIGCDQFNTPREAFAALIDKVLGKGTWNSNPYVFVYEFELID